MKEPHSLGVVGQLDYKYQQGKEGDSWSVHAQVALEVGGEKGKDRSPISRVQWEREQTK